MLTEVPLPSLPPERPSQQVWAAASPPGSRGGPRSSRPVMVEAECARLWRPGPGLDPCPPQKSRTMRVTPSSSCVCPGGSGRA